MEPLNRELLSRDEITNVLTERYLNIPSIELLPYDELLRIYKTFAVPLEKRVLKRPISISVSEPEPYIMPPPTVRPFTQDLLAHTLILDRHLTVHHDPHLLQKAKYLKFSFNALANAAVKRLSTVSIDTVDEATPAKRQFVPFP